MSGPCRRRVESCEKNLSWGEKRGEMDGNVPIFINYNKPGHRASHRALNPTRLGVVVAQSVHSRRRGEIRHALRVTCTCHHPRFLQGARC